MVVNERLFTVRNMGEGLEEDDLTATNTTTEDEREALAEAKKTLEKYAAENAELKHEEAKNNKRIVKFKRKMKVKDTEIQELRNQVRMLNEELDKLRLGGGKKRFTLQGLVRSYLSSVIC